MANYNRIMLVGNLTRDCELHTTPNGVSVCETGIAVNRVWNDQGGTKREEVMFIDLTIFNKAADTFAQYMAKGRPVLIEGRLKFDQWQAKDGSKRSKHFVIVENFQFLGDGQKREQSSLPSHTGPQGGQERTPPAPAPGPEQEPITNGHNLDEYAKPDPVPGLTAAEQRTLAEEAAMRPPDAPPPDNDVPF